MACQHCTEKKDWTRFGLNSRCPHAVVNGPRSPCVLHARAWTRVILNLARCAVTKVENPQATAQAPKGRASVCAALHHRNWCTCACELGTGRIRVETSRKQKHPLFLPPSHRNFCGGHFHCNHNEPSPRRGSLHLRERQGAGHGKPSGRKHQCGQSAK